MIIRKPKFMRNEKLMDDMFISAVHAHDDACLPNIKKEDKYFFMVQSSVFINKASKAGGFLSLNGFVNWLEKNPEWYRSKIN